LVNTKGDICEQLSASIGGKLLKLTSFSTVYTIEKNSCNADAFSSSFSANFSDPLESIHFKVPTAELDLFFYLHTAKIALDFFCTQLIFAAVHVVKVIYLAYDQFYLTIKSDSMQYMKTAKEKKEQNLHKYEREELKHTDWHCPVAQSSYKIHSNSAYSAMPRVKQR